MNPKTAAFVLHGQLHEDEGGPTVMFAAALSGAGFLIYGDDVFVELARLYGMLNILPLDHQIGNPQFRPRICVSDMEAIASAPMLNVINDWFALEAFHVDREILDGRALRQCLVSILTIKPEDLADDAEQILENVSGLRHILKAHAEMVRLHTPILKKVSDEEDDMASSLRGVFDSLWNNRSLGLYFKSVLAKGHSSWLSSWPFAENRLSTLIDKGEADA